MARGARDFRSGRPYEESVFFDEHVDIHLSEGVVFPKAWCGQRKIPPKLFDTVLDKTPLGYETNRIPGGLAPSGQLARLEKGSEDTPPIRRRALDEHLAGHAMNPALLRADDFRGFIADRARSRRGSESAGSSVSGLAALVGRRRLRPASPSPTRGRPRHSPVAGLGRRP